MEDEPLKDAPRAPVAAPIFRPPKMVSRPKPPQQQEEELGAEPRLGDFEGDNPLSISEARAVVTAVHSARKRKDAASNPLGGDRAHNDSQTITQFVEYLETFSKYKHTDNLHALAGLMVSHNEISGVEKAMLGRSISRRRS